MQKYIFARKMLQIYILSENLGFLKEYKFSEGKLIFKL